MLIQCQQKATKSVYDNMIEETGAFPTKAYQKHISELDIELSKEDFLNIFHNTLSSTASLNLGTSSSESFITLWSQMKRYSNGEY